MTVRKRVMSAYDSQIQRQQKANFALSPQELEQYAVLDAHAEKMMEVAQQRMNLSARSYHRILRVARTIADLSHSPNIEITHLSEINYSSASRIFCIRRFKPVNKND